jgi:hypothetical protein
LNSFTSILLVSPLADGNTWVLMRDFGFSVRTREGLLPIKVDIGFQTDFASIPRPFWIVLPKWGKYGNAAVIHDWLYWKQQTTRAVADSALWQGMHDLNVPTWQRQAIYWAVRVFGWVAWARNRADRLAGYDRVLKTLPTQATARSTRRGLISRMARHFAGHRMP